MNQENKETAPPELPKWIIAIRSILVLFGVLTGFFVAREVLRVYWQFGNNSFVDGLVNCFTNNNLFSFHDISLVVTEQGATIICSEQAWAGWRRLPMLLLSAIKRWYGMLTARL